MPDDALRPGETLVFVYGTFLSGERNHHVLGGARFVGESATRPEFHLVDLGTYPALVPGGRTSVRGELYAVSTVLLQLLDEVEDHPDYYRRTELALESGERAFGYTLTPDQASGFPRIDGGSWRRRAS